MNIGKQQSDFRISNEWAIEENKTTNGLTLCLGGLMKNH